MKMTPEQRKHYMSLSVRDQVIYMYESRNKNNQFLLLLIRISQNTIPNNQEELDRITQQIETAKELLAQQGITAPQSRWS